MAPSLSVIIPARDEEGLLAETIASVRAEADQVIVVDGGSRDRTDEVAEREGAEVLTSEACRGLQLDRGARAASGEWLIFLHADTRLEPGWAAAIRSLEPDVVGGAFRFTLSSSRRAYRLLELGVSLRCRILRLPFGDQGVFVRRDVYDRIGGFPPLPLMEDVVFARRLARSGRLVFPPCRALTSARRWEHNGIARTTLRNSWLLLLYAWGTPPERLARLYQNWA